jgi:cysteine desulfurase
MLLGVSAPEPIYLDNAATTPLDPRVRNAMSPWLDGEFGNPSSRHRQGQRAHSAIDEARGRVARAVGAERANVIFTSGGTEANNLAVLGSARARRKHGKHVIVGPTEHPCVRESASALRDEGFEVESARLAGDGSYDLAHFESLLRADTVLMAQMLVQNEVGAIYPVREIAKRVHARSPHAALHVDAVQAFGKMELSLHDLEADSLAISSHKVHGPQGAGALITRGTVPLRPLVFGGGQEQGLRSGTECVAAIVGFGRATELARAEIESTCAHFASLKSLCIERLARIEGARVLAPASSTATSLSASRSAANLPASRNLANLPAIVAVIVPGAPSEVRMHHLEELGVIVSAGSACHAHKSEASPTMLAMGISAEEARSMLRFSFSRLTTRTDVERGIDALETVCKKLAGARR